MKNQIDTLLKNAQSQRAKLASLERQIEKQKTVVQDAQAALSKALLSSQAKPVESSQPVVQS
jgi:hypothetical protein